MKMNKMKAVVTTLAAAALLVLVPGSSTLKADAAEAKNFSVQYCPTYNDGEWRYQEGSSFDESQSHREIYYLLQDLKAGDKIAVYNEDAGAPALDLGSVKLGDLTFCSTATTVVYTGGVSECNILAGSSCSVSGNIDTAHVYDVSSVTFSGNVTELIATADYEAFNSNIGCSGTVWHLNAYSINAPRTFYNLYNFSKDRLDISDGNLKTDPVYYDATAPATAAPAVTTPAPAAAPTAAPAQTASSSQTSSASEYDSVPKTGENPFIFWLLTASGICLAGSLLVRKTIRQ